MGHSSFEGEGCLFREMVLGQPPENYKRGQYVGMHHTDAAEPRMNRIGYCDRRAWLINQPQAHSNALLSLRKEDSSLRPGILEANQHRYFQTPGSSACFSGPIYTYQSGIATVNINNSLGAPPMPHLLASELEISLREREFQLAALHDIPGGAWIPTMGYIAPEESNSYLQKHPVAHQHGAAPCCYSKCRLGTTWQLKSSGYTRSMEECFRADSANIMHEQSSNEHRRHLEIQAKQRGTEVVVEERSRPGANEPTNSRRQFQDALLVQARRAGMSYKRIRELGGFWEVESTLRGRYRTLTQPKSRRICHPHWEQRDVSLHREHQRNKCADSL
jgi:hypothetical protein